MTENGKFLMLHIDNKNSEEVLKDAIKNQGIERGLMVSNKVSKELLSEFEKVMKNGYFPVGFIIDKNDKANFEFLFHRHPKQTESMKMEEYLINNPYKL